MDKLKSAICGQVLKTAQGMWNFGAASGRAVGWGDAGDEMESALTPAKRVLWLGDCDGSRENNFTIIRLVFAACVLFGHSWGLTGSRGSDPLTVLLGRYIWLGGIAVNGFFAISGFLVAASFARQGVGGYTVARLLRIFPGLAVCIAWSVFILGLSQTTLAAWDYLSSPQTQRYLLNATLAPKLEWSLPGVFASHPHKAVNGSLWTLRTEVTCYIVLALAGLAGLLRNRVTATLTCAVLVGIGYTAFKDIPFLGTHSNWCPPMGYFILGVLGWTHRRSIPLHSGLAVMSAMLTTAMIALHVPSQVFHSIFAVCFVYLIFYMAYAVPHLDADRFPGDLSYGIYIYAFPCQQLVFWNGQSPYTNAALAGVLTAGLAALSWFLIEKPALELKKPVTSWLNGLLHSGSRYEKPSAGIAVRAGCKRSAV